MGRNIKGSEVSPKGDLATAKATFGDNDSQSLHSIGGRKERSKLKEEPPPWPVFESTEWTQDRNKRNEMRARPLTSQKTYSEIY